MKQNAKTSIINSFKYLLERHSADKITVKQICEYGNVNRQTFYYYFTDIIDIFKNIMFEELTAEIAQNRTFDTWEGGFLATMNYFKRNSKMVLHVYRSSYWLEAKNSFANLSNKLLGDVVEECIEKSSVKLLEKDQQFIINFYRHVFNGLIGDWVGEGMDEEPQVILDRLLVVITGSIPRSVAAFAKS